MGEPPCLETWGITLRFGWEELLLHPKGIGFHCNSNGRPAWHLYGRAHTAIRTGEHTIGSWKLTLHSNGRAHTECKGAGKWVKVMVKSFDHNRLPAEMSDGWGSGASGCRLRLLRVGGEPYSPCDESLRCFSEAVWGWKSWWFWKLNFQSQTWWRFGLSQILKELKLGRGKILLKYPNNN